MEGARQRSDEHSQVVDDDVGTLHLRCGSDIRETLLEAGFKGDFLEYSDPLCQGPVPDSAEFSSLRARFLQDAYDVDFDAVVEKLETAENGLAKAAERYGRVVLWFEHDSYDQLILARVLAHFASHDAPGILEMVTTDRFPGIERFMGLGQLPPDALRDLWERRTVISAAQLALGDRIWTELRAPDPVALHNLSLSGCEALPYMARALRRHLEELPGIADGLGLTERLILEILRDGDRTAGQVYRELMMVREPLPWLGDTMFWHILRSMLRAERRVFDIFSEQADWPKCHLSLNDTGRDVLAERLDYLSKHPPERWVGGVRIEAKSPCWRWDAAENRPVLR